MSNSPTELESSHLFNLIQSIQAQGERSETQLQEVKIDFAAFKENVNARIEKGEIACETAVNTVRSSLAFWGERLTTAEAETDKTQDKLKASDEKLALRIAAMETQQKVQMGRLETLMKVGGAVVVVVQIVLSVLSLQ